MKKINEFLYHHELLHEQSSKAMHIAMYIIYISLTLGYICIVLIAIDEFFLGSVFLKYLDFLLMFLIYSLLIGVIISILDTWDFL